MKKNKILALLLVLVLTVGLVPNVWATQAAETVESENVETKMVETLSEPLAEEVTEENSPTVVEQLLAAESNEVSAVVLGSGEAQGTMTGREFRDARDANNLITLTGDTTLTSCTYVNAGESMTIDLNGYALIADFAEDYAYSIICCNGTLTIKSSNMTREHKGTLEKVNYWIDKRANYSTYGNKYDNSSVYYDRYDWVTTKDNVLWKYDGTGSTIIKGGVITGGFAHTYGGAIRVRKGGILNLQSGTIAGNAALRKIIYDETREDKLSENRLVNTFGGAVYVESGSTFNMSGGTICYNWVDYYGAAVCISGAGSTMNMTSGVITNNFAQGSGGGIGVRDGSTFNLGTDSSVDYSSVAAPVISYNRTYDRNYTGGGAGIEVTGATLNYEVGRITYNQSSGSGAGIYCYRGGSVNASTANSVITNNYAGGSGGAIFLQYGDVNLDGCILNNNEARGSAGAVGIRVGNFSMTGGEIKNNKAGNHGGAVYVTAQNNITPHGDPGYLGGGATITSTLISGNTAGDYGGAVYVSVMNSSVDDCNVTLDNCQITNNTAGDRGGAVYLCGGTLTIDGANTLVQYNTSPVGGAFYVEESDRTSTELKKNSYIYKVKDSKYQSGWNLYDTLTENDVDRITDPDIAIKTAKVYINAGTFKQNQATSGDGGMLYVTGTKAEVYLSGGKLLDNSASGDGGAVYVSGGNVTLTGGTIGDENAGNTAVNGGALYVAGGDFTMSNGTISYNSASGNGGAAYMAGGNATIYHGNIDNNKATGAGEAVDDGCGGAIYMNATNATLIMESGTMNGNEAANDGGAIYANGGTIYIGLEDCKGQLKDDNGDVTDENNGEHTKEYADRHHPVISENEAGDTGGGIALTDGVVHFYCGVANDNKALYKGVGKNVFMDGGEFHLYDGADVGIPRDPDLVIVGGKLHNKCVDKEYVYLYYYHNNQSTDTDMVGLAEYEEIMNLPDGEYFWDAPDGMVFLGWTAQGAASGNQSSEYVRNKEQYVNSGEPVEILDAESSGTDQTAINTNRLFDGTTDTGEKGKIMHLYALWAPKTSDITYVDGMTGNQINDNTPTTYDFSRESNVINIQPVAKPGYDLVGWYIYQDAGQNANWNDTQSDYDNLKYEPNYSGTDYSTQKTYIELDSRNGVLALEAGYTNFGDITLIAKFVPAYTDLKITKSGWDTKDENQVFMFKITGEPTNEELDDIEMTVTIKGNGFVLIKELPVGEYTVTEITDWSWRYTPAVGEQGVTLDNSEVTEEVAFTNTRNNPFWLSGDSWCRNWWGNGMAEHSPSN